MSHSPPHTRRKYRYLVLSLLVHACLFIALIHIQWKSAQLPTLEKNQDVPKETPIIFPKDIAALKPKASNFGAPVTIAEEPMVAPAPENQEETPEQQPEQPPHEEQTESGEETLPEKLSLDPDNEEKQFPVEQTALTPDIAPPTEQPEKPTQVNPISQEQTTQNAPAPQPQQNTHIVQSEQQSTESKNAGTYVPSIVKKTKKRKKKAKKVPPAPTNLPSFADLATDFIKNVQEAAKNKSHASPGSDRQSSGPIDKKPTFGQIANGFLFSMDKGGNDLIERKGNENIRPDLEEMKYISYTQKIFWFIQNNYHGYKVQEPAHPDFIIPCYTSITIDRQGNILHASLIESTGVKAFDDYYIELIKSSAPFPTLPSYIQDPFVVRFVGQYVTQKYYAQANQRARVKATLHH